VKRFAHTIAIAASPDEVWDVLVDLDGWSLWNILEARAPRGLEVGAPLRLSIDVGRMRVPARATVVAIAPSSELCWQGGVPGLFHAVHGFSIEKTGAGVAVTHHETFRGALVTVLLRLFVGDDPESRYRQVNEALRDVVEKRRA
jgi:hypothetical protein